MTRTEERLAFRMPAAPDQDEREFIQTLGQRLAVLRKAAGLTQATVAEHLGMSQQTVDGFEKGRNRVQIYALVKLSYLYRVPLDELVLDEAGRAKRGPDSMLEQRLARLRQLPRGQQRTVIAMIDGLLDQAS